MTPLLASSSKTLDRLMLKARDSWAPRCFGSEGVRISMYTWLLSPSDFSPVGRLYLRLMSSSRYPVNNLDLATRSAIEVFLNTCNELYSSKLILSKTAIWQGFSQKTDMFCQPTHLVRLFERTACQVKWFISETPVGVHERTSMKEHLLWHGSEHKMQVRTTKRNKQQQNKRQQETREISLTKTKARVKNENRWVQQTHTLTHSHALTRVSVCEWVSVCVCCTSTRLPTHPHTHHTHTSKIWGKRGGNGDLTGIHSREKKRKKREKKLTTLIEEKRWRKKKKLLLLYVLLTSEFTHNKFQKVC